MGDSAAQQLTDPVAHHGEGPVWWPDGSGLRWVDQLAGDVLHLQDDGQVVRQHVADVAAAVRPRRGGGAVLGADAGFVLLDDGWQVERTVRDVAGPGLRMNEGGCDPAGRFHCGTTGGGPGSGSLLRLDADLSTSTVVTGITTSNGLDWTADGGLAYYVDSVSGRVDVVDCTDGETDWTSRRPFGRVPRGVPDGLAVDAAGGVWVALWDGGAVIRLAPDGSLDAVVELPVPRVTACAFGGEALDRLFVTTSAYGTVADPASPAGAVFVAEVGVRGNPVRTFAG